MAQMQAQGQATKASMANKHIFFTLLINNKAPPLGTD
jgi:hypothetical protein